MPQLSRCTCNIKFIFSNQKTNGILCCCHRFLSSRGYSITLTVLILLSVFTPIFPFSPRPTKKSVASQSRELSQLTAFQTRRPYKQNLLSLLNDKPYSYHFSLASASSASDTQQGGTIDSKATSATTKINAQAEQLEQIKHKTGKDYPQRKNYNNNYNNSNNRYSNKCSVRQNKKRKVRHLYSKARDLERRGLWKESCEILEYIVLKLEPKDAHSYLALARLQSRRERGQFRQLKQRVMNTSGAGEKADIDSPGDHAAIVASGDSKGQNSNHGQYEQGESRARKIFRTGTHYCPDSIHLWHGWAMHEQSLGNLDEARRLLDNALKLDPSNGYVCHAYGMMEMQSGNLEVSYGNLGHINFASICIFSKHIMTFPSNSFVAPSFFQRKRARVLWQQGIKSQPSAALVCSLGQLYTSFGDAKSARDLYSTNVSFLPTEREQIEVYLAAASLEETAFNDVGKASELLKAAINDGRTEDSRPYVALARLGSQVGLVDDRKVKQRLREICTKQVQRVRDGDIAFPVKDGRLFNAWAKLESKSGRLAKAKDILRLGIELYPKDHTVRK